MKVFFSMVLLVLCGNLMAEVSAPKSWPEIKPFKKIIKFIDHQKPSAKIEIHGKDGKPIYLLECYLNAYDFANDDFDYSGIFECRLTSIGKYEGYTTLLTEEKKQTRDWQSRGRFLLDEISGKCADYPDYGVKRKFRLRGMDLTLEIKSFEVEPRTGTDNLDRMQRLKLEVTVASDPTALTEIAEPSKYVEPLSRDPKDPNRLVRDCDKVLMK